MNPKRWRWLRNCAAVGIGLVVLVGCAAPAAAPVSPTNEAVAAAPLTPVDLAGGKLNVVATTSIIGNVVAQVGGDRIDLTTLMAPGVDPHGYQLTPGDRRTLDDADIIFTNGLGLEEGVLPVLSELDGTTPIVSVNADVATIAFVDPAAASGGTDHADVHDHGADPHTWFSVPAVMTWTDTIAASLSALDPANAAAYVAAAAAYRDQLTALDAELRDAVATVPEDRRKLVTDHDEFGYFAAEYGFTVVGTVIPSLSTQAAPSAQDIVHLEEQITSEGVPAIFVGTTVNPALADQIAADTGVKVVPIYSGSLSDANGPAATYVDFMRANVHVIVGALR